MVTHFSEEKTEVLRGDMTTFKLTANRQQSWAWDSGPQRLGLSTADPAPGPCALPEPGPLQQKDARYLDLNDRQR